MELQEEQSEKLFYTIGEVARKFRVNPSLIRFWEKEFEVIRPRKNKKGNRLFTKEDMDTFHTIYHLVKERGHTLEGARKKLRESKGKTFQHADLVRSLNKVRDFMMELKKNL